jgi:NTP pyrophosphatase (non-canonical NTP hydrolase)
MQFAEYQKATGRTADKNLGPLESLFNCILGIQGEAGEVAELLKKSLFHGHTLDLEKLKKEIGDILFYLTWLCSLHDFDLDDGAELNIEKLKARYPEGFSSELSKNRKPEDN